MSILDGFKTCRKGLHQYPADKRQCPECQKENAKRWRENNKERNKALIDRWRKQNPDRDKENKRRWAQNNPDKHRKFRRKWYYRDLEHSKKLNRDWAKNNPEKSRAIKDKWLQANKEKRKETIHRWYQNNKDRKKETNRKWRQSNPGRVAELAYKYLAKKKQAFAPWANREKIKLIYIEAATLSKETGIRHEVDHIYPIQSDYLCGLHVETNLQILTLKENRKKLNTIWPGQLDCQKGPVSTWFSPSEIALLGD